MSTSDFELPQLPIAEDMPRPVRDTIEQVWRNTELLSFLKASPPLVDGSRLDALVKEWFESSNRFSIERFQIAFQNGTLIDEIWAWLKDFEPGVRIVMLAEFFIKILSDMANYILNLTRSIIQGVTWSKAQLNMPIVTQFGQAMPWANGDVIFPEEATNVEILDGLQFLPAGEGYVPGALVVQFPVTPEGDKLRDKWTFERPTVARYMDAVLNRWDSAYNTNPDDVANHPAAFTIWQKYAGPPRTWASGVLLSSTDESGVMTLEQWNPLRDAMQMSKDIRDQKVAVGEPYLYTILSSEVEWQLMFGGKDTPDPIPEDRRMGWTIPSAQEIYDNL